MQRRIPSLFRAISLALVAGTPAWIASTPALAQVVLAPVVPQVGSSNPVSPEPAVIRPGTTPCSVALFSDLKFADYGTKPIAYTPPTGPGCAGPWSKVVLTADFTVTAGRQFDRTAKFFLGGANIYFGTTAEPRAILSPSWHIERDVTDLSTIFAQPQTGVASIQNIVNSTYTGVIYATATLLFYPADAANPAAATPNVVLSLARNTTTFVNSTSDSQSATLTLPRNIERAYLDVIAQSQASDEFWYTCVPTQYAADLQNCGNTGFRETEVAIDGIPAGVAPVYPWIYTGGLDPYLWEPITGIETLNFKPYRVDLTPFAGLLSDGKPHTVSVSVFNAMSGFDLVSNLLLYTDPNAETVSGGLLMDTLAAAPTVNVEAYLNTAADGTISGPVNVSSARDWTISGYVQTSHGRVDTTIQASNSFKNYQSEKVSGVEYKQEITQGTEQHEQTTTVSGAGMVQTVHDVTYPLIVNYRQAPNDNNDGGFFVASYVKQGKLEERRGPNGPNSADPAVSNETVETSDTLHYSAAGAFLGHDNNFAKSSYGSKDTFHNCYYRGLIAEALVLTHVEDSTSCSMAP